MSDDTRHVTGPPTLVCAHCGRAFTHDGRPGPTPRYCRRSCRQRAYETRAAAAVVAVAHHPDAGLSASGRVHALDPARPDPRADGTRTTLCGTTARPSKRTFAAAPNSCARCTRAAASRTTIDHIPARDLAALLAAARHLSDALDRSHAQLALRLIHAITRVDRHLSRDTGRPHPPGSPPHDQSDR
jgi:hypothetical protein